MRSALATDVAVGLKLSLVSWIGKQKGHITPEENLQMGNGEKGLGPMAPQ